MEEAEVMCAKLKMYAEHRHILPHMMEEMLLLMPRCLLGPANFQLSPIWSPRANER